jgi:hypothetical protein
MVTIDRQHGTRRAVVAGLKPEDRVVVNGLMMVRPGAKVEVQNPAGQGEAPAGGLRAEAAGHAGEKK